MANREQQASIDALNLIASGAARAEQLPELMEQHPLVLSHFAREAGLRNNERPVVYDPRKVVNQIVEQRNPQRLPLSPNPQNAAITIEGLPNLLVDPSAGGAFLNTSVLEQVALGSLPAKPEYLLKIDPNQPGVRVQEDHIPPTVTAYDWRDWGKETESASWNVQKPAMSRVGTRTEERTGRSVSVTAMTGSKQRASQDILLPGGKPGSLLVQQETFANATLEGETGTTHYINDETFTLTGPSKNNPIPGTNIKIKGNPVVTGRNKEEVTEEGGFMRRTTIVGGNVQAAVVEPVKPRTLFRRTLDGLVGPKPAYKVQAQADAQETARRVEEVTWGSYVKDVLKTRVYNTKRGQEVTENLPYVGVVEVAGKNATGSVEVKAKESGWFFRKHGETNIQTAGGWTTDALETTIRSAAAGFGDRFSAAGVETQNYAEAYAHTTTDFDQYGGVNRQVIGENVDTRLLGLGKTPLLTASHGGRAHISAEWTPDHGFAMENLSIRSSIPGTAVNLFQKGVLKTLRPKEDTFIGTTRTAMDDFGNIHTLRIRKA